MNGLPFSGEPRRSRAVERLAGKLYEAGNVGGKSWLSLGWNAREPWLLRAREQIDQTTHSFSAAGLWRALKSAMFRHQT